MNNKLNLNKSLNKVRKTKKIYQPRFNDCPRLFLKKDFY